MGSLGDVPPQVSVPGIPRPISAPVADPNGYYRIQIPAGSGGTRATLETMAGMAVEASQDPTIIAEARSIVRDCASKDYLCEYQSIFDWVRKVITYRHDSTTQEMQQSPGFLLYVSGDGDCFTKGTKVLLRDGHRLVNIETLRTGDEIWGHDRWSKVLMTYEKGVLPTWRVRLNNGGDVRLTPSHHVWKLACPAHAKPCACPPSEQRTERVAVSELSVDDLVLTPEHVDTTDPATLALLEKLQPVRDGRKNKILRVSQIIRDGQELPCFDVTTDDHKVWLPEADWTTSQCNNQACLVAALLLAVGASGVKFRAYATDPTNPKEYTHVSTQVLVPGKGWVNMDTIVPQPMGWEVPRSEWVMEPMDFVVVG